ncbi:peptidoglycan-binding protein [Clostridium sp. D2Q-11]|uniref:Peptidoglycan-binding protein n=1 Tax=Anaeromonas frigoriresistens TaxID=2683708 RepID=A0A942UVF3_9FIRM|nr:peptidoglycan-binding protein [Anaeromonas frigoriresistens]MBS4538225.1 peptidoglycan-binding protein [Anaeromonas frigoriresistens]
MFSVNNTTFDPGHYAGANIAPRCSNRYSEGDNMLLLGLALNKEFGSPLTRYNGKDVSFPNRTAMAKKNGSKYLVSLHTNYPTDGVICFISVSRPEDKIVAEKIGKTVANKLGIQFRGVRTRKNSYGTDYYGMIRIPQRYGIHGIIVEHGSHREHCSNTDEKRRLIIEAYREVFEGKTSTKDNGIKEKYNNGIIDLPAKGYWTIADNDREISFMQEELNIIGYELEIDGNFGPNTLEAVKEFQEFYDLEVDGYVGPNTVEKIGEVVEALEKNGIIDLPGKGYFTTKDEGYEVKLIQQTLKEIGFKLVVDGIYGSETRGAIKLFQAKYGLKVDGYAGKETVRALNNIIKEINIPTRRVIINGEQIGAFKVTDNIVEQVKENLDKADKIEIEKVE